MSLRGLLALVVVGKQGSIAKEVSLEFRVPRSLTGLAMTMLTHPSLTAGTGWPRATALGEGVHQSHRQPARQGSEHLTQSPK